MLVMFKLPEGREHCKFSALPRWDLRCCCFSPENLQLGDLWPRYQLSAKNPKVTRCQEFKSKPSLIMFWTQGLNVRMAAKNWCGSGPPKFSSAKGRNDLWHHALTWLVHSLPLILAKLERDLPRFGHSPLNPPNYCTSFAGKNRQFSWSFCQFLPRRTVILVESPAAPEDDVKVGLTSLRPKPHSEKHEIRPLRWLHGLFLYIWCYVM